jgi:hypothetical protein
MASVLLLASFVTKVYAAEDFPTSDLGLPSSGVRASGEFNEVMITLSGFPGQTGESVTVVDLTPSPCSVQNDSICTGSSDITIPGIGGGHLILSLHNHQPVILLFVAVALLFIPSVVTIFEDGSLTGTMTIPTIGTGQVTIQLL